MEIIEWVFVLVHYHNKSDGVHLFLAKVVFFVICRSLACFVLAITIASQFIVNVYFYSLFWFNNLFFALSWHISGGLYHTVRYH